MRDTVRLPLLQTTVARYMSVVATEARTLFHRRKLSYALLAITLTTGAVYVASTAYPMVTGQGTPSSSSSRGSDPLQSTTNTNQGGGTMSSNSQANGSGQSASSGDVSNNATTQSTVTVNGRNIDVPENGSVHTTVPSDSGQTSVDITHESSGGGNSSSLNVHVESQDVGGDAPSE